MDNERRKFRSRGKRKRRFYGNQHSSTRDSSEVSGDQQQQQHEVSDRRDGCGFVSSQQMDNVEAPTTQSASKRKLDCSATVCEQTDGGVSDKLSGFRLMDLSVLSATFEQCCVCKSCRSGNLVLSEDLQRKKGLSMYLELTCSFCHRQTELYTSSKCDRSQVYEVNRRAVLAMATLGQGLSSLESFCADMDMPPPMTPDVYRDTHDAIIDATKYVAQESMQHASNLEHETVGADYNTPVDTKCMFDGTWRRRGHASLQGGVTAISPYSGKVLDYEILNKFCKGCSYWESKDKESVPYQQWAANHKCSINHEGSAAAMEPIGVKNIYLRSVEERKLRYTQYIGDGDSKSFSNISEKEKPYGNVEIVKLECVGHVQKRMGTGLRNLKKSSGKKKLSDNKTLGGRGRLTNKVIDKLQIYYGLAIRRNKQNLKGMKREILAGLYHSASTDENPQHQYCPEEEDTWCKWQQAKKNSTSQDYEHKHPLPPAVIEAIKPLYTRLSQESLLKRCLEGHTQNNCESINSLIWQRCPKEKFSGIRGLSFAFADAVIQFNEGKLGGNKVLERLGIQNTVFFTVGYKKRDSRRIVSSITKASEITKKIRQSKRQHRVMQQEHSMEQEGTVYESGAF
ncbi:uncharacterized protein LOC135464678 [Liolophura sinensis]|uniref:uncharacterized protein LOC135464678 n=1 Tax=Liolophura sinensis TaxID=3198878 RepID=UPI003159222D